MLFVWILLTIDMGGDRHCHYPKGDPRRKDGPRMNRKKRLKLLLTCIVLLMVALVGYKIYLFVYEADYKALNAENIDQIALRLQGKDSFSFAVVGNVENSMKIFEKRFVPLIKDKNADFMISVGNAVSDGDESKYRLLHRGFKKLGIPYILAIGQNEVKDSGTIKFYRHFGPLFFSFHLADSYFIFLDSTGQTSWKWQERWLKDELELARRYSYRFVVLNQCLLTLPGFDPDDAGYIVDENRSIFLQGLFSRNRVTAVFSSGYPGYHEKTVQGVRYIVSGGGGGLLLGQTKEPYQFVRVIVGQDQVTYENMAISHRLGPFLYKLETLKLFLHSFFYMSLFNFLVTLSIISLFALKLYSLLIRQEHFYRDFSIDEKALSKEPLRVAMFTNNYLPFTGGVPISVDRLYRGLVGNGTKVKLFAPLYPQQCSATGDDDRVFRCPVLFHTRKENFPISNIFSRKIEAEFKTFDCDLVHVHHPFWLGKKGMQLARKRGIPVVFTYHTRLERYTHYIPLPGTILKNLIAHLLIKRFANRCDAIITPTASTEEYLRNLGVSALIETIPTGINMEDYKRWSHHQVQAMRSRYAAPRGRLLISVSRMALEKNLDFMIDGLVKVKNRTHSTFKCILIGDGPEKERLEKKVADLGMDDWIVFTGYMAPHEVALCYLAADLFVFASTSETQGMVLLEAMAGGCPVVAVRASGVYDVVKDGYNGFKVAESTDNWAEAVANLLEDDKQRSIMSENSQIFARDYSMKKTIAKISRLYRRVVILGRS